MAKASDVLKMLIPNGGWIVSGNDYEGIQFLECEPITKAEFESGFPKFDAWQAEQDAKAQAAKDTAQGKLEALGLTLDDLKALGL
jgi:hypothetical protein